MNIYCTQGCVASSSRTVARRLSLLLLLGAAISATPSVGFGQANAPKNLKIHPLANPIQTSRPPPGANAKERVHVVVTMTADSVASVRARTPDHTISGEARHEVERQAREQHASIEPAIAARGGRVLAHFHSALNGMRVEVARDEVAGLAALPGVVEVVPVGRYHLNNSVSVPFIGAPAVWQGTPGFRGENIKIAVIDTGIDYTHANFGGPGTPAAYAAAHAASVSAADPALFGPNAPKVKGGYDFVGDNYDPGSPDPAKNTPMPDPNPLDCQGHGSHTSGTAAGFGVANNGTTYQGPYDSAAYQQGFLIGPGVAPKADLYALRVFGCAGSTNVVTEAIDWAVANNMDVISMSLGADYGGARTADSIASDNAAKAGISVVAAAGNAGPQPYILGSPAAASGAIAVAATDAHSGFPGEALGLTPGTTIEALDSNGIAAGGSLAVVVLPDTKHTGRFGISLGCDPAEYAAAGVAGKLVVTVRGSCARVDRAIYGQQAGAAAVVMVNSAAGYPPFEGPITSNPDTGQKFNVTIPFLGVLAKDAGAITAASATTLTANSIPNPGFRSAASFSSGGPSYGDSAFKPNVTAPGVAVVSTLVGSGNQGTTESGTSMATPHVAGVAALARQAHPRWEERELRAAVTESASPNALVDYTPRIEGAGLVQAVGATATQVVATGEGRVGALSFGFRELFEDFQDTRELSIRNHGHSPAVFNVTATPVGGSPHTVAFSSTTVSVNEDDDATLRVTLSVPAATVGSTHDSSGSPAYQEVAGYVTLTPTDPSMNNGVSLTVPYYLVPRARSNVRATLGGEDGLTSVRLANRNGVTTGFGDFYAWGLQSPPQGLTYFDPRAVGVQSNQVPSRPLDRLLVFAVNTHTRFSNPARGEFDILIDVNGDGIPDFDLVAVDLGVVTSGRPNGQMAVVLFNLATGRGSINFLADAPTDGSTALLPVWASRLGLTPAHPRFTYTATASDNFAGTTVALPGAASFNAYSPSVSTGMVIPVDPNGSVQVPFSVDPVEFAKTPALGIMVVTEDNAAGSSQADLLRLHGHD